MPSRRKLKKSIKNNSNLIIEDAFIQMINGPNADEKKLNKIIDELIDARFDLISKVSQFPRGSRKDNKAHFQTLKEEVEKKMQEFQKKI